MEDKKNLIVVMYNTENKLKQGNEFFTKMIVSMDNFINILEKIEKVVFHFNRFDKTVKSIRNLSMLLSQFPIIGPTLNVFNKTISIMLDDIKSIDILLNTVKKNIKEVTKTLKGYIEEVKKINTTTNKLISDISNYICISEKCLNILKYMKIFLNLIKYINKYDNDKIVNRINEYKKTFESIYEYINQIYNETEMLSKIDIENTYKIFKVIEDDIDKIEKDLEKALNIFSPIESDLNKIYKYLVPFQCVLKSGILNVNNDLKSAINFIMKDTDIKKHIYSLSDKTLYELVIDIKKQIQSLKDNINIKELDIINDIKIISNDNIINTLENEFSKIIFSNVLTNILQYMINIDINKPFVIDNAENMAHKDSDYTAPIEINKSFENNITYKNKNYYLEMNYSIDNYNHTIENDIDFTNENNYIDVSKLENSKCFKYNKNDIDELNKYSLDFVNNVSNIYNKIMIANNNINKLDYYTEFIDSYLYELNDYNSLISEISRYTNKINELIKNNDKYNKLYQIINKLNNIISNIIKQIDEIRVNINLLYNSKEYLLNEIKYIFDLIRNKTFLSDIKITVSSYADQLNNTLYILDSLYDNARYCDKVFLREKADNLLEHNLKYIEDNISIINKDVLKIENDFDTVISNIKDYDDYIYDFVSKYNFIPKEIYSNTFNIRNIIKNIYDNINFESYIYNIFKNYTSQFAETISKSIDLKIDENIINYIENKISVNDMNSSLEYINAHNEKFNKLLNSINEINKNDINLNNYTDNIYNMIKYKFESNVFLNKEEIEKIEAY